MGSVYVLDAQHDVVPARYILRHAKASDSLAEVPEIVVAEYFGRLDSGRNRSKYSDPVIRWR